MGSTKKQILSSLEKGQGGKGWGHAGGSVKRENSSVAFSESIPVLFKACANLPMASTYCRLGMQTLLSQ